MRIDAESDFNQISKKEYETGHVIGVGTDLEMETWTQTFFENRIHLAGISLRNFFEKQIKISRWHQIERCLNWTMF